MASEPPCWTLWGCALEGSFSRSVGGGEAEEAGRGAAGVPWSPPRSKAECHRKVASSAIALQSDGNTPQPPEVKEHFPGEGETLVVSRDRIIQTTQGTTESYDGEALHIHTVFSLAAKEL